MLSFGKYLSLATISAVASAATDAEKQMYPTISSLMDVWKLTWEPHKVITEDGYHIDMFRITGSTETGPQQITKPPLLTVSPMRNNAEWWIDPEWPG